MRRLLISAVICLGVKPHLYQPSTDENKYDIILKLVLYLVLFYIIYKQILISTITWCVNLVWILKFIFPFFFFLIFSWHKSTELWLNYADFFCHFFKGIKLSTSPHSWRLNCIFFFIFWTVSGHTYIIYFSLTVTMPYYSTLNQ